jgi:glycosyltransferase involved in cell wall biosynthesis
MSRLRLFTIISSTEIGGAERIAADLLKGLDPGRFEIAVACAGRGPMLDEFHASASHVSQVDLSNVFDIGSVRRLRSVIAAARPDIVHTHLWNADVIGGAAARLARVPVVVSTVYGAYHLLIGVTGFTALRRSALSRTYRLPYRLFDRVVALSEYVRRDLVERPGIRVDSRVVDVIHAGIDESRLAGVESTVARSDVDRGRRAPQIVNVANFFPIKGQEWLIRALPRVLASCPNARCVLVGDGPDRPAVERLAADLGLGDRVEFAGTVRDPSTLVRDSDVFVLPSLSEALSIAILEASALGVPVVASRVGGIPEVIEDGLTGLLVPPKEPAALAGAIVKVLSNREEARTLAAAAKARVREHFSSALTAARYDALYQRLIEETQG